MLPYKGKHQFLLFAFAWHYVGMSIKIMIGKRWYYTISQLHYGLIPYRDAFTVAERQDLAVQKGTAYHPVLIIAVTKSKLGASTAIELKML